MIYDFGVQEPYKSFLIKGTKTIEGRLNKGKFAKIKTGDILMMDSGEKFLVLGKKTYKTFFDMMTQEGIKKVLPDKDDILDGVNTVYYRFYSKEEEKEFGISAIELNFLKD